MEGIQTFKGSWPWPWPWIRPYGIPSCITHRPLPIYQISLKSKKLFVDGRTYGRTHGRTFPPSNIIRSTFGSRHKNEINETVICLWNTSCSGQVVTMNIWSVHGQTIKIKSIYPPVSPQQRITHTRALEGAGQRSRPHLFIVIVIIIIFIFMAHQHKACRH